MNSYRILGFLYGILLFPLFYGGIFVLKKSSEQYDQSNSVQKDRNELLHLVFIGDSLTRYQYLTIAYKILFGSNSVIPRKLVDEKLHASWNDFFKYSTHLFQKQILPQQLL